MIVCQNIGNAILTSFGCELGCLARKGYTYQKGKTELMANAICSHC